MSHASAIYSFSLLRHALVSLFVRSVNNRPGAPEGFSETWDLQGTAQVAGYLDSLVEGHLGSSQVSWLCPVVTVTSDVNSVTHIFILLG